jgi:hypothetical protein
MNFMLKIVTIALMWSTVLATQPIVSANVQGNLVKLHQIPRQLCKPRDDIRVDACLNLPATTNGSCGHDFGFKCTSACCSEQGVCVNDAGSCKVSNGCQLGFGSCVLDTGDDVVVPCIETIYVTPTTSSSTTSSTASTSTTSTTSTSSTTSSVRATTTVGPKGGLLYGIHVDWGTQSPIQFANLYQINPSVYGSFLNIATDFQYSNMDAHVELVLQAAAKVPQSQRKRQLVYNVAVMPWGGIRGVTDNALAQLVRSCKNAEAKGVHIIVRFGHEMVRILLFANASRMDSGTHGKFAQAKTANHEQGARSSRV